MARNLPPRGRLSADHASRRGRDARRVCRGDRLGIYPLLALGAVEIEVRRCGDAAVLRDRSELEITVDGELVPRGLCWHTDYFERRRGRWQVVWSQVTAIGRAPTHAELERLSRGMTAHGIDGQAGLPPAE